jgi:endogenous inhibitor of DNA gyrase (YacG/DUF329 family)
MSRKVTVKCTNCGIDVLRSAKNVYATTFCSAKCISEYRRKSVTSKCSVCGKEVTRRESSMTRSKSGRIYCSKSCAATYNNSLRIGDKHPNWSCGIGSYRTHALYTYGAKCQNPECELNAGGIDIPEKMLDVHHIDHDRRNNVVENLLVLCVWCHAKVTRKLLSFDKLAKENNRTAYLSRDDSPNSDVVWL